MVKAMLLIRGRSSFVPTALSMITGPISKEADIAL